ncbi:MAG: ABC transporter ATP-binding protein, partial [Clostridia bacterium]|nr:ABC transporter ATP-binding protein [Clostridia bacterium]
FAVTADIKYNTPFIRDYLAYFDIPVKMYQGTIPVEKRYFCEGGDNDYEIEFQNVSFRYPGSDSYALKNVSIKYKIGEKLAIVGMNGSGKTTFIKLLCRLYDPTEGVILLNGINIQKYNSLEYLSILSVVFQDYKLFSFSLAANVAASSEYDETAVVESLEKAGFGERLKTMPNGIETVLYKDFEQSGTEISGGEGQKIAIARAIYKNAPFVILDEPTAALDPIAEYEVYSKFNEIVGDRTAIYISHRLSSCRFCDRIAVFDDGQIVQLGTHETLVADETGKYYQLWSAQAQYYT